jgi:hypothetical protein
MGRGIGCGRRSGSSSCRGGAVMPSALEETWRTRFPAWPAHAHPTVQHADVVRMSCVCVCATPSSKRRGTSPAPRGVHEVGQAAMAWCARCSVDLWGGLGADAVPFPETRRIPLIFDGHTAASGGDKLTLSPEECAARQLAYERKRAEWRLLREAERRHASGTPLEGHTGEFGFGWLRSLSATSRLEVAFAGQQPLPL